MKRFSRSLGYTFLAGASLALMAACAVAPSETASVTETTEGPVLKAAEHLRHVQVTMRDGVRLDTEIFLPEGEGPFPTVLIRTPYDTEISRRSKSIQTFFDAGYAVVEQHERGRYFSEGEMRMLGQADEDGWDTLDWIAAQPWSDGGVATYGCSSSAENQLKLSTLGHPAHKAMIAYSAGVGIAETGPYHEQGNFWRGGAWQMGWADYFYEAMAKDWPQLPAGMSDEARQRALPGFALKRGTNITQDDYAAARMHLPAIEIGSVLNAPATEIEEYLIRGPSHEAWDDDRITSGETPLVPGLYAEALYDISARTGVARFEETRESNAGRGNAIVITNAGHCDFGRETEAFEMGERPLGDARFDYAAREVAFLDRWLTGDETAQLPEKPVTVYMAGANQWAAFDGVPEAGTDETLTFYLSSEGAANTLDGNGILSTAPQADPASDTFVYDPADPVIARGGEIAGMGPDQFDGAYDQREIEARQDVLVYTSAPLEDDVAVFGFINTELFVSSDAPDTDFTVKLVDVAPDGTAWNIADTIQRMRYRDGVEQEVFMEPGETYAVTPPPMLAANVFQAGHRIRVEVSSSNFPTYARNLNTTGNPYTTTEIAIATNTVRHGPETLSRIELPIVELPD
ncbi:MAG: CocE/NonD family hydrolase [Pseudomonadota bacterium]